MPVEKLPVASWQTALGLGFVSAVFDKPVAVAYVVGFFVMLAVLGWHPDAPR
jgi:hypothetical protein